MILIPFSLIGRDHSRTQLSNVRPFHACLVILTAVGDHLIPHACTYSKFHAQLQLVVTCPRARACAGSPQLTPRDNNIATTILYCTRWALSPFEGWCDTTALGVQVTDTSHIVQGWMKPILLMWHLHRTHRVAIADFWRTSPSWWKNQPWLVRAGGGCTPTPFHPFTMTYKVAVYAPAERVDTLSLFHLYPICTLWWHHST